MFPLHFSLAEIMVLAGTAGAGAGRIAPSTRISVRLNRGSGTQFMFRFSRLQQGDRAATRDALAAGWAAAFQACYL